MITEKAALEIFETMIQPILTSCGFVHLKKSLTKVLKLQFLHRQACSGMENQTLAPPDTVNIINM